MSRSIKKESWVCDKNGYSKKLSNKKFRRRTKQKLNLGEEVELPDRRTLVNGYDICDWKFDVGNIDFGKQIYFKGKKRLVK